MLEEAFAAARDWWRRIIAAAYPLYADRPVVVKHDAKAPSSLEFYTDGQTITAGLHRPGEAEREFRAAVVPVYAPAVRALWPRAAPKKDAVERELWVETCLFALFHELYHPLVCPNSRDDERAISAALFRGVRAGLPSLTAAEAVVRVDQIKNLVWDIVVNTAYLARLRVERDPLPAAARHVFRRAKRSIDGASIDHLSAAALPTLYLSSAVQARTDLLITIMGAFYAMIASPDARLRERALDAFRREGRRLKSPSPPEELAIGMLDDVGRALAAVPEVDPSRLAGAARGLRAGARVELRLAQDAVLDVLRRAFEHGRGRYVVVEAVGRFLAPFLRGEGKQGTIDAGAKGQPGPGGGSGAPADAKDAEGESQADTLQDLIEALAPSESQEILGPLAAPGAGAGKAGWSPLSLAAADEFYRRASEPLEIRVPDARPVIYELGRQKRWRHRSSQMLTGPEVAQVNLGAVLAFQRATGLPALLNLAEGFWQLNEYAIEESPVRSYTLQSTGVELPDAWVLVLDSSGSMGGSGYVGSGQKYDILMRVCYGVAKGLDAAARALGKSMRFGVASFSDQTRFSGMMDFAAAFAGRVNPVKRTMLQPQLGGTTIDLAVLRAVEKEAGPGRVITTLITDGDIGGDVAGALKYLADWAAKPGHSLVFIEIGGATDFGNALRAKEGAMPSIACRSVGRVEDLRAVLGRTLVRFK